MTYVRVEKRKFHYIYKTTCLVSNRYYIGMHSTDDLNDGYVGSGKRLRYSIRKHGLENHSVEIMEYHESRAKLAMRESELVNPDVLTDPLCMNLKLGGEGGQSSEIAKRNWENPAYRVKMTAIIKARANTDAAKARMLNARSKIVGEPSLSSPRFSGMKHSDDSKLKMSMSKKNCGTGVNNSQHGTCWVSNHNDTIKIDVSNLDVYLLSGWVRGRKLIQYA